MLTCLPQSICSWNYRILGAASGSTAITFSSFSDSGTIFDGDQILTVRKQGVLTSHWSLEANGEVLAEADKPKAFSRLIELTAGELSLTIVPRTILSRAVDLRIADRVVGSITPMHALTRRATIDCAPEVPELIQLFAFWVTAVLWRRASQSD